MILDPQNMGFYTLIVELCALLAEIWRNIHFPVMASLICIKMVCGTFCQLFNIANRFLWYFLFFKTSLHFVIISYISYKPFNRQIIQFEFLLT